MLRDDRAILLDFSDDAPLAGVQRLFGDRLRYLAAEAKERFGLSAMFVRPNGIVAWATETVPDSNEARIAISRWVGEDQS